MSCNPVVLIIAAILILTACLLAGCYLYSLLDYCQPLPDIRGRPLSTISVKIHEYTDKNTGRSLHCNTDLSVADTASVQRCKR